MRSVTLLVRVNTHAAYTHAHRHRQGQAVADAGCRGGIGRHRAQTTATTNHYWYINQLLNDRATHHKQEAFLLIEMDRSRRKRARFMMEITDRKGGAFATHATDRHAAHKHACFYLCIIPPPPLATSITNCSPFHFKIVHSTWPRLARLVNYNNHLKKNFKNFILLFLLFLFFSYYKKNNHFFLFIIIIIIMIVHFYIKEKRKKENC